MNAEPNNFLRYITSKTIKYEDIILDQHQAQTTYVLS